MSDNLTGHLVALAEACAEGIRDALADTAPNTRTEQPERCCDFPDARHPARPAGDDPATPDADVEALAEQIEDVLVGYDEDGNVFGTSGAGAYFLAKHLAPLLAERDAKQRGEGWDEGVTAVLIRPVNDVPNPYRERAES